MGRTEGRKWAPKTKPQESIQSEYHWKREREKESCSGAVAFLTLNPNPNIGSKLKPVFYRYVGWKLDTSYGYVSGVEEHTSQGINSSRYPGDSHVRVGRVLEFRAFIADQSGSWVLQDCAWYYYLGSKWEWS